MSDWVSALPPRRDVVTIRTIHIAIVLSLLLHGAVMWQWKLQKPPPEKKDPPPLTVKLRPLPGPPPAVVTPPSQPRPSVATPVPRAAVTPPPAVQPAPPVIAQPRAPSPVEPAVRAPSTLDFAAALEAKQRARGDATPAAAPPAEDDNARATRLAIANLATSKAQGAAGNDPNRSGGIFTMKRKGVDYAEFMFHGWHADARRNMDQLVEVRLGGNSNIELAVVRKMIEIIRSHVQGDFTWRSHRMNRVVTLSARQQDTAALEEFMLREFFFNPRIAP